MTRNPPSSGSPSSNPDAGKRYFITAAPQCPRPDASIPIPDILPYLDFVMVQFYNNPVCNIGSSGFIPSLQAWDDDISVGKSDGFPRLLIGAIATTVGGGTGYVAPDTYRGIMQEVKGLGLENLGGAMFWDGSYVELVKGQGGGQGFAEVVREVFG
jgi:chitinase